MKRTLTIPLGGYGETAVEAICREDTPPGLWVHKAHGHLLKNEKAEWRISHDTGYLVLGDFLRQKDALDCAVRLKGPDWKGLTIRPGVSPVEIEQDPKPYTKACQFAVIKYPRTKAGRDGHRWRVAI